MRAAQASLMRNMSGWLALWFVRVLPGRRTSSPGQGVFDGALLHSCLQGMQTVAHGVAQGPQLVDEVTGLL